MQQLNKLTNLHLSSSRSLVETPNFDCMPNLEILCLSDCVKLEMIHPSIGNLQKLVSLDLSKCCNLKNLPSFDQVSSLKDLKLENCSALEHFPEIRTDMEYVKELNLECIQITELPPSIGRLCGLTKLRLIKCDYLVCLSNDLCELKSLEVLEIKHCRNLKSLPENLGNLSELKELYIIDTAIFQLPSSINQLGSLECLRWSHWGGDDDEEKRTPNFVPSSVSGLSSLKRLELSGLNILGQGLPSDLGWLSSLEYLDLRDSYFVDVPESFSQLRCLQYFDIRECVKLENLPKLPKTTRELYADSRFASRRENINALATWPELHSVTFCSDHTDDAQLKWPKYYLAMRCIYFWDGREAPFSVSYPTDSEDYSGMEDSSTNPKVLMYFQYRYYKSNTISIDLNTSWYSEMFVGFGVYFLSSEDDIWGPHSNQDIDDIKQCVIIATLSHKSDPDEVLHTTCVIAKSYDYKTNGDDVCFAHIPFHSFRAQSHTNMNPNDYSRFEVKFVNLKAHADWGCSLLYGR